MDGSPYSSVRLNRLSPSHPTDELRELCSKLGSLLTRIDSPPTFTRQDPFFDRSPPQVPRSYSPASVYESTYMPANTSAYNNNATAEIFSSNPSLQRITDQLRLELAESSLNRKEQEAVIADLRVANNQLASRLTASESSEIAVSDKVAKLSTALQVERERSGGLETRLRDMELSARRTQDELKAANQSNAAMSGKLLSSEEKATYAQKERGGLLERLDALRAEISARDRRIAELRKRENSMRTIESEAADLRAECGRLYRVLRNFENEKISLIEEVSQLRGARLQHLNLRADQPPVPVALGPFKKDSCTDPMTSVANLRNLQEDLKTKNSQCRAMADELNRIVAERDRLKAENQSLVRNSYARKNQPLQSNLISSTAKTAPSETAVQLEDSQNQLLRLGREKDRAIQEVVALRERYKRLAQIHEQCKVKILKLEHACLRTAARVSTTKTVSGPSSNYNTCQLGSESPLFPVTPFNRDKPQTPPRPHTLLIPGLGESSQRSTKLRTDPELEVLLETAPVVLQLSSRRDRVQ